MQSSTVLYRIRPLPEVSGWYHRPTEEIPVVAAVRRFPEIQAVMVETEWQTYPPKFVAIS